MILDEDDRCYYCGELADTVDHVVPQSYIKKLQALGDEELKRKIMARRRTTVPCCHECNCLLGATIQKTLGDRKLHLKNRLKRRYKKILGIPKWSERELEELGPALRQHVRAGVGHQEVIERRLQW